MTETTFTLRVEADLKAAFVAAAKVQDRTAAQLLRDYMRDYVKRHQAETDYDAWFRRQVQEALDDPRPGIPHEEIEAEFAALREKALAKLNRAAS
ncbi:type II toxin-antitoxin system RelB family antitoxin [Asticcacaulis taihuensis]|uniref:type II toxin-antitoxin system RelB family antitoxin n=1 Tax=Asticcacaulis taihuensis TaxID=260084 RepID=UPI003F7CD320